MKMFVEFSIFYTWKWHLPSFGWWPTKNHASSSIMKLQTENIRFCFVRLFATSSTSLFLRKANEANKLYIYTCTMYAIRVRLVCGCRQCFRHRINWMPNVLHIHCSA